MAVIPGYQQAFREYGIDIDALPSQRAAELIRAKPPEIREALAAALDDWAWRAEPPEDSRLRTIARDADRDEWRNAIRDAVAKQDTPALRQRAHDPDVARQPAATLDLLGDALIGATNSMRPWRCCGRRNVSSPTTFGSTTTWQSLSIHPSRRSTMKRSVSITAAVALSRVSPGANSNLGLALQNKGRIDEAIDYYSEAILLNPRYAPAYNGRGNAWFDKQEYNKAIADYDEAILLNPKYALAYNGRGNAWYAKQEYGKAIADHEKAIELDPKLASAYNGRGNAWYAKQEYNKAIADYDEAILLNPKYALDRQFLVGTPTG